MGATKLNIKHLKSINAVDVNVNKFLLNKNDTCSFILDQPVDQGEMVLIKASFKNACEGDCDAEDDSVLFRRRVVPFVTRVTRSKQVKGNGCFHISTKIESMTAEDRSFFFKKYFDTDEEKTLQLELEGKHIRFAMA